MVRQGNRHAKEAKALKTRVKALEEQIKQSGIKKQGEKYRKQVAMKASKKEVNIAARSAALLAELEAAKEEGRQLKLELENLGAVGDNSSSDEGPREITPQETLTNNPILPRESSTQSMESSTPSRYAPTMSLITASPPAAAASLRFSIYNESRKAFFKKLKLAFNGAQSTPSLASPFLTSVSSTSIYGNRPSRIRSNKGNSSDKGESFEEDQSPANDQSPEEKQSSEEVELSEEAEQSKEDDWFDKDLGTVIYPTEDKDGIYGGKLFGPGTGGKQGIYGQMHEGYGMPLQQTFYDQQSLSSANLGGFAQQQLVPSQDRAANGTLASYNRSGSALSSESRQYSGRGVGGYGKVPDIFACSTSWFPSQLQDVNRQLRRQSGGNDDTRGGYRDSAKVLRVSSPALGQMAGLFGSEVNGVQEQTDLSQFQTQSQQSQQSHKISAQQFFSNAFRNIAPPMPLEETPKPPLPPRELQKFSSAALLSPH